MLQYFSETINMISNYTQDTTSRVEMTKQQGTSLQIQEYINKYSTLFKLLGSINEINLEITKSFASAFEKQNKNMMNSRTINQKFIDIRQSVDVDYQDDMLRKLLLAAEINQKHFLDTKNNDRIIVSLETRFKELDRFIDRIYKALKEIRTFTISSDRDNIETRLTDLLNNIKMILETVRNQSNMYNQLEKEVEVNITNIKFLLENIKNLPIDIPSTQDAIDIQPPTPTPTSRRSIKIRPNSNLVVKNSTANDNKLVYSFEESKSNPTILPLPLPLSSLSSYYNSETYNFNRRQTSFIPRKPAYTQEPIVRDETYFKIYCKGVKNLGILRQLNK